METAYGQLCGHAPSYEPPKHLKKLQIWGFRSGANYVTTQGEGIMGHILTQDLPPPKRQGLSFA